GGHAAGEVASGLAIAGIERGAARLGAGETALTVLEEEVDRAHQEIRTQAVHGREGMGCTLTAAVVSPGLVELLHIGDSRAYRLRGESITQLTKDDSLVGEMLRHDLLTIEQARSHPARSVLTRALGVGEVADFSTSSEPLAEGDLLLLCSDGLTSHLTDETILATVQQAASVPEAVTALIEAANGAGGSDNITVVLVRCAGAD
ncbi:MAG: serine/threonine-protein phosphatase, partial [Armatimonadetes bacterium]|nr:serine/threonine-protein phosphatase [Armatimonadota bacterium]